MIRSFDTLGAVGAAGQLSGKDIGKAAPMKAPDYAGRRLFAAVAADGWQVLH